MGVYTVAVLVLLAVPGPNHIYIATRSATQGRAAGIASAFGVEAGTLVHLTSATVGLSALIASWPTALEALRYLGAGYLVVLGIRAVRATGEAASTATEDASNARAFRDGVLVNLLNPKVVLFFLAFMPQFLDPARGPVAVQTLVLGSILVLLGIGSNLLYAFAAAGVAGRTRGGALGAPSGRVRWLAGGVYVSLGAVAALSGGRH